MAHDEIFDVIVVGGGPAGATAANDLAEPRPQGRAARQGRPHQTLRRRDPAAPHPRFRHPRAPSQGARDLATMVSPKGVSVDMPIDGGFVGMVDREEFDEWLRERAERAGAKRFTGKFEKLDRGADGLPFVHFAPKDAASRAQSLKGRIVIGADGANSAVARRRSAAPARKFVFAYHEIVDAPVDKATGAPDNRCEIYYRGTLSPDFYAWIFPHGYTMSVGTGSAHKGFSLKGSVTTCAPRPVSTPAARSAREGAPIPLKPLPRWDNGRDVVLAGDAAGVVAPASGEGIYYAMLGGRLAAEAAERARRPATPARSASRASGS